jgi:hypothetical protein
VRWSVLLVAAGLGAASCGGSVLGESDGTEADSGDTSTAGGTSNAATSTAGVPASTSDAGSDETSNDEGTTTAAPVDCEGYVGVVSPEQAAATPRSDWQAEFLGTLFTDEVIVPDDVYERAGQDREALMGLGYWTCLHAIPDPRRLMLSFVEHYDDALDGSYEAWACPNELYGAFVGPIESQPIFGRGRPIVLQLQGMFDIEQIAADYTGLPGIDSVEAIPLNCHGDLEGPGPIEALYACPEGDTWHYWWTDAYVGQDGYPITSGVQLASEPGAPPVEVCTWSEGGRPCEPPACIAEILTPLRG